MGHHSQKYSSEWQVIALVYLIFAACGRVLLWLWVVIHMTIIYGLCGLLCALNVRLLNNRDVTRADVIEILAAALWVFTATKR